MSQTRQFTAWLCGLSLIGVAIAATGAGRPAAAATPVLAWEGARRLAVHCLVDPDRLADRRTLQAALCDRVKALAADRAPVPVVVLAPGDPGLIAPDTAVLLFHANVQPGGGGPLLVFSLRVFRAAAAPSALFGAAPRAVALTAARGADPSLDAALNGALAETLPWRSRPAP